MTWTALWLLLTLTQTLAFGVLTRTYAEEAHRSQTRTWKTVDELSPQELRNVDLSANSPRHGQIPYLPAEPYPFAAPYTAEEMGYRAMEFTQRPRWSCIYANLWGSISPAGVLLNPGKSVTFLYYPEPVGVEAEFVRKPGEELYRSLNQNTFPPDAEGSQRMTIRYRTDHEFVKKEESFMYSPSIRRVRHQAPTRRQDQFPNQAQTFDDATGRDAWEFSWRFIGTDVLHRTVRFPVTRPTVILGNGVDGSLHEVRTADIKLMGNAYSYYTADGGVECYVVEARAREDWLPNYYAPRLLYWLEKHSFYPLRIEQYGRDGKLTLIETRLTDVFNPALGEWGYGPLFVIYWDLVSDVITYSVRDNHRVKQWIPEERHLFFNPDFMRRQWYLDMSVKSQAEVAQPEQFFLRPGLEEGKFPSERSIQLPPEVAARVQAQESAGRLVFEVEQGVPATTVETKPVAAPVAIQREEGGPGADGDAAGAYVQHADPNAPATLR
ncbi:MAG TPA: DUF1329 domain-containing protein [Candidatus Binatia bacterium]|nr:DUF1329 domain-containing protein [Candidatus Binatia bacterium]